MDIILLYLAAAVNLLLAAFVLIKNRKSAEHVSFFFVALSLGIWAFTWAVALSVVDIETKLFWTRMMLAGPSITPSAFMYFSLVFPKEDFKINPWLLFVIFILPPLISLGAVPTALYIKSITPAPWGIDFSAGLGYPFYTLYFSLYLAVAFIWLIIKYRKSMGTARERIRYLFLGTFISAAVGFLANLVLPLMGVTFFNRSGPISTVILVSFTAYAITKYRLMNISVVISRALAEVVAVIIHTTIYLSLVWFYRNYASTQIDLAFIIMTVSYGIIVGQSHHSLRLFIQTTSDKLFLRGRYDYYKSLSDASAHVGEKLSLAAILKVLYETFSNVVEISNPRVYLPENFSEVERTSSRYLYYTKDKYLPQLEEAAIAMDNPIVTKLINEREPLLDVREISAALVVPCLLEDRLIALFVLGKKLSEDPYTDEDVRLLKVLANQAAVALDHTRSYEKIKGDLEIVERELGRSQRLASLGTLTAGVTHEIRNPLAVIRSETERLTVKPRDAEYLAQYSNLVIKHVDRIAGIVSRMLDFAKEKPKVVETVDLNEAIRATLQMFAISRITLKLELAEVPPIKGDAEELQEVFVNLIQNAIEAMPEGGTLTLRSYAEEGKVVAEVSDTGKGIPEEVRQRIFDPFFSTRHEGVGLGLSIVYRIIREHGAEIKVFSEAGKGTTFKIIF